MRLFIAINISDRSKKLINNKMKILKNEINEDIKWVDKENWHITIKFLGEVRKNKIDDIKNKIDNMSNFKKFYLQFNKINAFPNLNYPKVIYLAINRSQENLIKIHKEIEKELLKINFKRDEREYTPHLTIARTRKSSEMKKISKKINEYYSKKYFINIFSFIEGISLMKSELTSEGAIYTEIFTKKF